VTRAESRRQIAIASYKRTCVPLAASILQFGRYSASSHSETFVSQNGPVILVGHSWAGMVISEAGNDPKVAALVYIAALVPDEGQSSTDVVKPYPPSPGLAEAKPDAAGFLSLSRKGVDEILFRIFLRLKEQ
jgi:pimeloyl-ACP methyl ester carboxylesterase